MAAQTPFLEETFRASGEGIADGRTLGDLLQLLLIASDRTLIECLEFLIDRDQITIPPTEVRHSVYRPLGVPLGFFATRAEVSRNGVRLVPTRENISVLRLQRLVRAVHEDDRDIQDLEWNSRRHSGATWLTVSMRSVALRTRVMRLRDSCFGAARQWKRLLPICNTEASPFPNPTGTWSICWIVSCGNSVSKCNGFPGDP